MFLNERGRNLCLCSSNCQHTAAGTMSAFSIQFRKATIGPVDQPIFRDFSWSVEPFQSWVITGPNGSGKSALAQALAGGLAVSSRAASSGEAGGVLAPPDSV